MGAALEGFRERFGGRLLRPQKYEVEVSIAQDDFRRNFLAIRKEYAHVCDDGFYTEAVVVIV